MNDNRYSRLFQAPAVQDAVVHQTLDGVAQRGAVEVPHGAHVTLRRQTVIGLEVVVDDVALHELGRIVP